MKRRQVRTSTPRLGFGTIVATLLLFAAGVTGCSKVDDPDALPPGKYPINFTAAVDGLTVEKAATRATTDGSWAGNEVVAVKIEGEVKKYKAATDGKLTVDGSETTFYWTTTNIDVEAWYLATYTNTKPTSFTVQEDQSSGGYQSSDILYASQSITFNKNTQPSLTFRHLPAKVVVNLKAGDGVTEIDVQNATVSIESQNLTSGEIAVDWSVTQQTTQGNASIVPNVLGTAASGYQKTVQALLVPQKSTTSTKFIKVAVGSQEFYYSTTLDFSGGQQHTYNITVLKSGITVTASGATEWTGTTSDVTSKDFKQGFAPIDLKIGDYYYSDGKTSDGGYREYTDGTKTTLPIMPVLTDASNQPRTVIGIVFWVGNPANTTNGDPLLAAQHSTCTHGLVVALHEAKNPSTSAAAGMKWSVSTEKVNNWTNHDDRGGNKVNITERNRYQGYANTVALKAYNNENTNVQGNADLKGLPIAAIEQYSKDYPAPANSSGWYVPSIMELQYMCWGQGNSGSTTGRDLLNGQFAKAGGTNFGGSSSWSYWSSSEDTSSSSSSDFAWNVGFSSGGVYVDDKRLGEFWVRAVFAF